jgi:5,10-methylenetetrahydromethanopterin reductase
LIARRFGIGLRGNLAPGEYAALARLAERLDFDVVSVFHDLGDQPAMVPLLEVAKATRRVAIGPACLNPYTMTPGDVRCDRDHEWVSGRATWPRGAPG